MSCKTPYGSEDPKYLLSSPFQRGLCWFLSKQSPALNNTIPLPGSRRQGLFMPFWKNNNGATFSEKSNQFNKMNVLRTCLLELMGVLESSFTLGRNSGQALGWIPLTKHSPHCLLQSPPDGAANYHRIQTCGYPRQKVCVFPGWEEGPPKLTWSL